MAFTTLAGTTMSFSAAVPATYTAAGYAALTWTAGACSVLSVPKLSRSFNAVEFAPICSTSSSQKKGRSKFDPVTFTLLSDWADAAQMILEAAEASLTAVISVKILFQDGKIAYFTAQVAKFDIASGGTGDDQNKRDVELWIQSQEITKV